MFGLSALETKLASIVILVIAFASWLAWHDHQEIAKGEARIEASDKKADDALDAKTKAETARDQAKADAANVGARSAQQAVTQWILDHPAQPVRLCLNSNGGAGRLPSASQGGQGTSGGTTGPTAIPKVLVGDPGPDISGALDAILSSAEELAIVYQESVRAKP